MAGVAVGILLLTFFSLAAGPRAMAGSPATQPAPAQSPGLETQVRNLANPDPHVRDAARSALMRLSRDDLPELKLAIKKARPLLPSQASAVRGIVRQVYISGEQYKPEARGFLGILMDRANPEVDFVPENDSHNLGIVVTERIPGFCAGRVLLDGDILLGTARPFVPFRNSADLVNTVMPRPGITVLLSVLRQGEVIVIALKPDPKPLDLAAEQIPPFTAEREKRFSDYWQREFANLLNNRVAG